MKDIVQFPQRPLNLCMLVIRGCCRVACHSGGVAARASVEGRDGAHLQAADRVVPVAAVLYGIGTRLDEQPQLLFTLRKVDSKDLVARAGAGLPLAKKMPSAGKILEGDG
jgi:hypothetical protein